MKQKILNERRKNDFYRTLFDNAYEAIIIVDIEDNARIVDANNKAIDLFGYTYDEITSLSLFDLSMNPELTKQRIIDKVFEIGQSNYKGKDGRLIPITARISRLQFSERYLAIMVIHDLTDEKAKEEKIIASENKYKAVLENLQEGFYQTNIQGEVIFVSQSAIDLLGFKDRKEVLFTPIRNYFANPIYRDDLFRRLKEVPGGKLYDQESFLINAKKEIITISLNCQLILDGDNNVVGTQGTFRDITESKKRLAEITKLYQVVEGSQNALVVIELDGTISYANNATIQIAKSPEWVTVKKQLIGKHVQTFLCFVDYLKVFEIVMKDGKWFGEAYISCNCGIGEKVPVDVMLSKIGDNGSTYIVASFYDATERHVMEDKIREQSRMYEELQNDMSTLVMKMNTVNSSRHANISRLEEAFVKSVEDFHIIHKT